MINWDNLFNKHLSKTYDTNNDLPENVREGMPKHAQDIFRNAFNSAMKDKNEESAAFAIAYGAVENAGYKQNTEGDWEQVKKSAWNITFDFAKADDEQRIVFGWLSVVSDKDGKTLTDHQGDVLDETELEKAVYDYVLQSRIAGKMHEKIGIGKLVESCMFTSEKIKKMDIPEGSIPVGWWVGYKIEDEDTWRKIKTGEYSMFSIGGRGERVPIGGVQKHLPGKHDQSSHGRKGNKSPKGGTSMSSENKSPGKIKILEKTAEEYKENPQALIDELVDSIGEEYVDDKNTIGLRGIYNEEMGKEKLKNSNIWEGRDWEEKGRELSGTSAILVSGDWADDSSKTIKNNLNTGIDRALKYGDTDYIAVVRGKLETSEVFDDPQEVVLSGAEVVGYIKR